jgi:hypothetical protein
MKIQEQKIEDANRDFLMYAEFFNLKFQEPER